MARRPPTEEQVRAGAGWGTIGCIAAMCAFAGMVSDNGQLFAGGIAALILVGILGAFGGA